MRCLGCCAPMRFSQIDTLHRTLRAYVNIVLENVALSTVYRHMPRREVKTVVWKCLHREIVETDGLFSAATATCIAHKHFLSKIVVVKFAAHRCTIGSFNFSAQWTLKLLETDSLTLLTPIRVYILHIPIEAAELRQKLRLVQILSHILHIGLDPGLLVKAIICIVFCVVKRLAKGLIDPYPFGKLVMFIFILDSATHHSYRLVWLLQHCIELVKILIVHLGKEVYLDIKQVSQ